MNNFQIKLSSWVLYILIFVCVAMGISLPIRELGLDINILLHVAGILIVSILLIRRFAIASTEWEISKSEIHVRWLSQFLFHKRKDILIKWDDIYGYTFREEKSFDFLKIVLKNGDIFRFWHDNLITNDDFEDLLSKFLTKVEKHNEAEIEKEQEQLSS